MTEHPGPPDKEMVEQIRHLINHPAWTGFYVPSLKVARDSLVSQLLDPSERRRAETPDDYIRARIHTLDTIIYFGQQIVDEADAARERKEQLQRQEQDVQAREAAGHFGPIS